MSESQSKEAQGPALPSRQDSEKDNSVLGDESWGRTAGIIFHSTRNSLLQTADWGSKLKWLVKTWRLLQKKNQVQH